MSVPRSTRAAVGEALGAVVRDLSLPRLAVRWFRGARAHRSEGDAALSALGARIHPGLKGAAVPASEPPVIWLRASLRPALAALVAAHEARHLWQQRTLAESDRRRWHEPTSERDADDYAWHGAMPEPLKLRARAALVGRPLARRFGFLPSLLD